MILRFLSVLVILQSALASFGATVATYRNSSPIHAPPAVIPTIDATTFINESVFDVNNFSFNALPFQTLNTLYFRNEAAGLMTGTPGFRFDYFHGNIRDPMASWVNKGSIYSQSTNQFFFLTTANWLTVLSDRIVSSGTLSGGAQGLVKLQGGTIDLSKGRIRTGDQTGSLLFLRGGGAYLLSSNYFNDLGVTDLWWGVGSNNVLRGQGSLMPLDQFSPGFALPGVQSPVHEVIENLGGGFLFTNTVSLPYFFGGLGYQAATYVTNQTSSNMVVQIVFYPTNFFETNLTTDVRFAPDSDGGATAIVGFHTVERDIVTDTDITNSVYLLDALAFQTNIALARNAQGFTLRPNTYEVTKGTPYQLFRSSPPNVAFSNSLVYSTNYASNAVPVAYTGYAAQISAINTLDPTVGGVGLSDPTNYPGRIEIWGTDVSLKETRIRADSTLILKASNLTNNSLTRISAPFMNVDIGTTQPQLVISNLAPKTVNRLSGNLYAWSATWNNTDLSTTNNIRFHVLIVDHSFNSSQSVVVNQFIARGNAVVLHDYLNVQQKLKFVTPCLDIKGSGGLSFPPGANWAATNMVNIVKFTNNGLINITGSAYVGTDRGYGYDSYVNRGTNTAQVQFIQSEWFDNPGCLIAQGGAFELGAGKAQLLGAPARVATQIFTNYYISPVFGFTNYVTTNVVTNATAKIAAASDISITTGFLTLSNAFLQAGTALPGKVTLAASGQLVDAGPSARSYILASAGIEVPILPPTADLMGTYIVSSAPSSTEVPLVWPGTDWGAVPAGFTNNLAVGKLTLDGGEDGTFRFSGTKAKKAAIYVDYLELLNNATNINTALVFDETLIVYFANGNFSASKVDGAHNGKLRWVRNFTGPLSSTNITYPSGRTYTFNAALVRDKDIDSDGDGILNPKDRTPIFVDESVALAIERATQPGRVLLSWQTIANATSYLDYKPSATSATAWQTLWTTNAVANGRISYTDALSNRTQRVYRIRMNVPPP